MGLSTERKVFIGLFLVAGGALVMDQAILGPKSAEASVPAIGLDFGSETALAITPSNAIGSSSTAAALLNERLEQMGVDDEPGHSLSTMFGFSSEPEQGVGSSADSQSTLRPAAITVELPALSAVMPAANGGGAVLNGTLVREGEINADGFRLITVRRRSVVIEKNGETYTVVVPVKGG